jgi:hypothetical protein
LRLRWELGWAHALLLMSGAGRWSEPRPEVHLYLADIEFRLADEYERAGHHIAAERHRRIANAHAASGPPPEPPPAAAMAMPVPRTPTFTDTRGKLFDPDDVA